MRSKSSEMMNAIYKSINDFFLKNQRTPSTRELSDVLNLSKSSVQRYLVAMNESGLLEYSDGHIETDYMTKFSGKCNFSPLAGSVICGDPNVEEPNIDAYINLPPEIFGNKNYYILIAKGDSMIDEGIEPGDYIIIESDAIGRINDIVVALDDEGQNTLKKFVGKNVDGKYVLKYCNENKYPGKNILVDTFTCQGVLRFVIKKK